MDLLLVLNMSDEERSESVGRVLVEGVKREARPQAESGWLQLNNFRQLILLNNNLFTKCYCYVTNLNKDINP